MRSVTRPRLPAVAVLVVALGLLIGVGTETDPVGVITPVVGSVAGAVTATTTVTTTTATTTTTTVAADPTGSGGGGGADPGIGGLDTGSNAPSPRGEPEPPRSQRVADTLIFVGLLVALVAGVAVALWSGRRSRSGP